MRSILILVLCLTFQAQADQYLNPVLPLNIREKELAMLTLQSHYNNIVASLAKLKIPVLSRTDSSTKAFCVINFKSNLPSAVPNMSKQGGVFDLIYTKIDRALGECHTQFIFTHESLEFVSNLFLEIYLKNSGTAFCKSNKDCQAFQLSKNECTSKEIYSGLSSYVTDLYLLKGLQSRYGGLMDKVSTLIDIDIQDFGERHPDFNEANLIGNIKCNLIRSMSTNGAVCKSNLCQSSL